MCSSDLRVMGMGEAVVDEERILVPALGALVEVVQHLLRVPGAALLVRGAAAGLVMAHGELLVRRPIAVPHLAGPHGVVSRAVEHGGQGVLLQVGWAQ